MFFVILVGMFLSDSVFAGSKKTKPTPAPSQGTTIVAVTAESITVKEPATTKTLAITQFTEITVNGRKGTAVDLKPGMTVHVTLGTDATKASRISATGK